MDIDSTFLIGTGLFGLGLIVWIFCAYLAYQNAPKRGRRAGLWALLAIVFGPFALFALFVMAPTPGASGGKGRDPREDLYEVPRKK